MTDMDKMMIEGGERDLVHTIALVIDANYHTAISKALSTAAKIVDELTKRGALVSAAHDEALPFTALSPLSQGDG